MTQEQKDKLWVDYFVTRFFWNKQSNNNTSIVGIEEFHKRRKNFVKRAQDTGADNYQSWNWKHNIIK